MTGDERRLGLRLEQIGIETLRAAKNYVLVDKDYLDYRECEIYAELDRMDGKIPRGIVDSAR